MAALRILPFVSYGDSQKVRGNQNIHLIDENTIVVTIGRKEGGGRSTATQRAVFHVSRMSRDAGLLVRQLVDLCAKHDGLVAWRRLTKAQ